MPRRPRPAAVEDAVRDVPGLRRDLSVMLGVSGGRDSVALLHAMIAAGYRGIIVCHLDHALRPQSEEESWMVAEMADQHGLPFESDRVDVRAVAADRKLSIETAAREVRYEFFRQVARAYWCPRLMLAHHADDQVETFLFNLLRGSGRGGLAAMTPVSTREINGARLQIHRPLLGVWRREIDEYVSHHGLSYSEDASNADPKFTRSRLRHELLPELERVFGREVKGALWRSSEILAAEEEVLGKLTPALPSGPVRVSELVTLPLAIQRRAIHAWLMQNEVADLSFDDVERVRGLLIKLKPAKVNVAKGRHVRRRAGKLFVE